MCQNPTLFHDKKETFNKLGVEGNFFNSIKDINKNPTANFILNGEKTESSALKIRNNTSVPIFYHFYLTLIAREVLTRIIR